MEKGKYPVKASGRERRIIALAHEINQLMRSHKDRYEAIDAYDVARVFFRRETDKDGLNHRETVIQPTSL